jgi:hypothetical protein
MIYYTHIRQIDPYLDTLTVFLRVRGTIQQLGGTKDQGGLFRGDLVCVHPLDRFLWYG